MLHEYRDIIKILKTKDAHFAKIFEKHNALDDKIKELESQRYVDQVELEKLKKEKLNLKDKAYAIILEYKKQHN